MDTINFNLIIIKYIALILLNEINMTGNFNSFDISFFK